MRHCQMDGWEGRDVPESGVSSCSAAVNIRYNPRRREGDLACPANRPTRRRDGPAADRHLMGWGYPMRFGLELRFEGDEDDLARVARLAEIGYQYVHLSVDCLRCGAEPEAYYAVRRSLNRAAVRPEVFSWAMPPGMPLVGDDVHWPATEKHLALALERIEETGGQVLAFPAKPGAPIPADYPVDDAVNQVRYFLGIAADYAGPIGIALGDLLHSPEDADESAPGAAELLRLLGRPEIRLLLEGPWSQESVPTELDVTRVAQAIVCGDEPDRLGEWVMSLARTGYAGRVTVRLTDLNESAASDALEAARRVRGA